VDNIMTRYKTIEADITKMDVDVIVNAANEAMLGGGGVDGAIHRAAGPRLLEACKAFPVEMGVRVPTGGVRVTPAFDLPSKFIVHTAGPIWNGGCKNEDKLLGKCYLNSLKLASLHGESVAIPAISTGIYGFPIDFACEIAIAEINSFIFRNVGLEEIFLVTFNSPEVSDCFKRLGVESA
jgi:O-acetyl-ADP-ribose deacetylase (regulator of RNase III)